eukprot:Phypoly_transcript_08706.p1 GENE.Phypoly_transcript_08706~~Phypoly_transcript_08706.p1  ORF type:complete len:444 (+),score=62.16 Phypoly_transcript_08706:105-1436(+)
MCLRTRVQVSKTKVEKTRPLLHPYANNNKSIPATGNSELPPARSPPARVPTTSTAVRSPTPNHSPNHVRTLATTPGPGASLPSIETLTNDVATKWTRPLHSLPIAGDFPRLAKVTTIYVGPDHKDVSNSSGRVHDESAEKDDMQQQLDDSLQPPPSSTLPPQSLEHIIYSTLIKLAIYLHDPTTLQSTKDHFWEYHKGDAEGEVARNFGMFLKSCLHDGDNVGCVLKSINQAILAPAVISLKMAISALPFKDYGNSWRVKVFISNDDFVEIVHVRREQSFNPPQQAEAMKFEFVWELCIRINLKSPPPSDQELKCEDPIPGGTETSRAVSPRATSPRAVSPRTAESSQPTGVESPRASTILPTSDKSITSVTLQIVEIAFGPNVPPDNKEKILGGIFNRPWYMAHKLRITTIHFVPALNFIQSMICLDMRRLTSTSCVVTTIA